MKVIVDSTVPYVAERLPGNIDVLVLKGSDITPSVVRDADALVASTRLRVEAALLEGSSVRLVATGSIGMDHIDTDWCETKGIRVVNAPGCNAPAVVQYVVCSLRKAGFDFKNQTLGVVGYGNIGSLLTRVVRQGGGRVAVCDPPRADAGNRDEEYLPLEELLRVSDAVTFHVPKTTGGTYPTYHLLSADNIGMIRPAAVIVNASRGGVMDENAILKAENLRISPIIVDTWEGEPRVNTDLVERAFIASPHIAGYSLQGKQRAARSVLGAIGHTFDIPVSTDSLADYSFRTSPPSLTSLLASYNPVADSAVLKASPGDFERIRLAYAYRQEA